MKFTPIEYNARTNSIASADFNEDVWVNMVVANTAIDSIQVFSGSSDGTFSARKTYSTGAGSHPGSAVVGDLNEDDQIDVAVANDGTNSSLIFFGTANGTFASQMSLSTNSSHPLWVGIAPVNDDGQLDLIAANFSTEDVTILHGDGHGSFSSTVTLWTDGQGSFSHHQMLSTGAGSYPIYVSVSDVTNDGINDVVVSNRQPHNTAIFLGDRGQVSSDATVVQLECDSAPFIVVVGDVNGDDLTDVVVGNQGTDSATVLLQDCEIPADDQ